MTVKSQAKLFPRLLSNRHYSGTMATLVYNWPIFMGAVVFSLVALGVSLGLSTAWGWALGAVGMLTLLLLASILATTYVVYDWGTRREYDRLIELGHLHEANVIIDVTAGKLRGTRGLLDRLRRGHYFVIDIFNPDTMTDHALRRARDLEPKLDPGRRIYRRPGQADKLPLPHHWADAIVCNATLHELHNPADRAALFREFYRVLKPGGRVLVAEQALDSANLLTFGPGAISFLPPRAWEQHVTDAGLTIEAHERWRGLVHLWVAKKEA